jgi:hypothetical protein
MKKLPALFGCMRQSTSHDAAAADEKSSDDLALQLGSV